MYGSFTPNEKLVFFKQDVGKNMQDIVLLKKNQRKFLGFFSFHVKLLLSHQGSQKAEVFPVIH